MLNIKFHEMKKLYLLVILSSTYISVFSQSNVILDSAIISCTYLYEFLDDSTSKYSRKSNEMTLQIGSRISKFVSTDRVYSDSVIMMHDSEKPTAEGFQKIYQLTSGSNAHLFCRNYIYKNYPANNEVTLTAYLNRTYFIVSESVDFKWKIEAGTRQTIAGYQCQKAITSFAGRIYEAWFTTEIPISDGPYKFHGLPGLILKISDSKNHHVYTLTSFSKHLNPVPIYFKTKSYKKISSEDFVKVLSTSSAELYNRFSQEENIHFNNDETKARALNNLKSRNNFIEIY